MASAVTTPFGPMHRSHSPSVACSIRSVPGAATPTATAFAEASCEQTRAATVCSIVTSVSPSGTPAVQLFGSDHRAGKACSARHAVRVPAAKTCAEPLDSLPLSPTAPATTQPSLMATDQPSRPPGSSAAVSFDTSRHASPSRVKT